MNNKQAGLSLLECLLVLVIAGSLITMAIRYYFIVIRNLRINQAIHEIKSIQQASYEWLQAHHQENFSNQPNGVNISLQQLIDEHLIAFHASNPMKVVNPWGGVIRITPGNNPNYVKIIFTHIPKMDCLNLQKQTSSIFYKISMTTLCTNQFNQFSGEL